MKAKRMLVYGVGVNDADYPVQPRVGGKQIICPFYRCWQDMLGRCYSEKLHKKYNTYSRCSASEEWHSFMTFRSWMDKQEWEGNHLDKDILIPGNKIYAPDRCVFIAPAINRFVIDSAAARGAWPIGVSFNKRIGKFQALCRDPFSKRQEHIGYFDSPNDAHEAWRMKKHELALIYASQQADPRIAVALSIRYLPNQEIHHD